MPSAVDSVTEDLMLLSCPFVHFFIWSDIVTTISR